MTKLAVNISDHAILRYLERVGGFEIDRLRAEIADRVGQNYADGVTSVTIEGFHYLVKTGERGPVVVTVLKGTDTPCPSRRKRK